MNIEEYASSVGLSIVKKLGHGTFGNAFLTNKQEVIKKTNDPNEVLTALRQMKGETELPLAKIYAINRYENIFFIRQEFIATTPTLIADINRLKMLCNYMSMTQGAKHDSHFLANRGLPQNELNKLSSTGKSIVSLFEKTTPESMLKGGVLRELDAKLEHVGYNRELDLVFYDLRDGSIEPHEALSLLNTYLPEIGIDNAIPSLEGNNNETTQRVNRVSPRY